MDALIEADGLTKKFGKVQALAGLDLTLAPGEPVAILGPNGAGKTTFIRMVATLIQPDRGTLRVDGHDVVRDPMAVRRMIGLAGQSAAVEEMMTGRENLVMVAPPLRPVRQGGQAERAAHFGADGSGRGCRPPRPRPIPAGCDGDSTWGRAWSARPACSCSTSRRPGSTRAAATRCGTRVREMSWAGTDIVLTTQYLDEADHLAAHIVIIDGGRVIAQGTPGELKSRVGADMIELHTADVSTMQRAADVLGRARRGRTVHRPGHTPVLHRCAGRRHVAADRRARARRGGGPGGGHRAPPAHSRRGVPRPHRPHDHHRLI